MRYAAATALIALSVGLLFFRLGHYPLWEDEADTALFARGVARTGDTTAVLDQNVVAFRNGGQLIDLKERFEPPAAFYLAAPFVGREGTATFWPRFPFAACGLATIGLIVYWLWRDRADALTWVVLSLGIVTNVSLMLYFRQCRYYGFGMLLTTATVYCYLHRDGRVRCLLLFSVLALLLLLTHYLMYAGLFVGLAVDYVLFDRRRNRMSWRSLAAVIGPQILFMAIVVPTWYPFGKGLFLETEPRNWLLDRLTLLWWNLRELNDCEFGAGLLMLVAPLAYWFIERNVWLLRAWFANLSYILAVSVLSPQPVGLTSRADIRYLCALIPLCIYLTALVIMVLSRRRWALAIPLALLAFCSNLLNHPVSPSRWRSTPYLFIQELSTARQTPIQLVADWVNENMLPGQSVWVMPDFMTYPLMYHAPHPLYAWQLRPPPAGQFKDLPPIHFQGLEPPAYIVTFGASDTVSTWMKTFQQQQIRYVPAKVFDIHCNHGIRPELFKHRFEPIEPVTELLRVYILKRQQ